MACPSLLVVVGKEAKLKGISCMQARIECIYTNYINCKYMLYMIEFEDYKQNISNNKVKRCIVVLIN